MLFHSVESTESGLYINQLNVSVVGLNVNRFRLAWQAAVARHDILRTGFVWQSDFHEPLQFVMRSVEFPIRIIDWRDREIGEQQLRELALDECKLGFDLTSPPLQRVLLVCLAENHYQLIWTSHHILMDGWSRSQLMGEVLALYFGDSVLSTDRSYRDYIAWLKCQDKKKLEHFWKSKLLLLNEPTCLATCVVPVSEKGRSGHAEYYLRCDKERTSALKRFALTQRVTVNTLIQATWLLLLQKYTGQSIVTFGATVAGRPLGLAGVENLLGLFINTLPIIQQIDSQKTVGDWLRELQQYNLYAREYEHAPLQDIQRWAGQSGQPIFDSILVFENYPLDQRLQLLGNDELNFGTTFSHDVTNFAMGLGVNLDETLTIEFVYLRQAFSDTGAERIRDYFNILLATLIQDALCPIGNLGILPVSSNFLPPQNLDIRPGAPVKFVHEVIARQAMARPNAPALICGEQCLNYAELERRANHLANCLIQKGVGPEVRVGVALPRSVELPLALLAILKAGGVFVPLDISYPAERLAYQMADSQMALLLTNSRINQQLAIVDNLICLNIDDLPILDSSTIVTPAYLHTENLAYLIYTSGSTGLPKGVAVAHGAIAQHCQGIIDLYELGENSREFHFMSFAFDGAQERWLSVLMSGGRLVIRDEGLWTAEQTLEVLRNHQINVACFPPAYLMQLAEAAELLATPPIVHTYCFGGEAVSEASFERVKRTLKPQWLINGYGPTETVVTPLLWRAAASEHCAAPYAPIGHAVAKREVFILDNDLNLLPVGIAGELFIGGECLARGYLLRPALTAGCFVPNPFTVDGGRLYRTGDIVRQRQDGLIDYLGRLDQQVKIRGFRIELGEIESHLRTLPRIKEAVVTVHENAIGKYLIAYVTGMLERGSEQALSAALRMQLPDYMVPTRIIQLDSLPLTTSGKIDRRALPEPDWTTKIYRAPRNKLEEALAAIWAEVLGISRIGIDDNFFELGGDSLQVLKVISKVRTCPELGLDLKLRDLMQKPYIRELSGFMENTSIQHIPDSLLLLNTLIEDSPPLFCLHGGFGTVFDYEPLARRLNRRRTVYGIQCRMLFDSAWQDISLEQMAKDYAQRIRQIQVEGPYYLLGWSLGGTLALLVAYELESQGEQVVFAGLVDSFIVGGSAPSDWRDDLSYYLAFVLKLPLEEVSSLLSGLEMQSYDNKVVKRIIEAALALPNFIANDASAVLSTVELTHIFTVGNHLKQLAFEAKAPAIPQVAIHCWWNPEVTKENNISSVQIPYRVMDHTVQGGHFELMYKNSLLDELVDLLDPVSMSAITVCLE
ncbi:amino acid adenylation domain-containing protein [Azomonas macrocytogenes]|uniref:Amino acid adenylation domain-containing protein n=2 Tax=Azomonas macrocytogenes TaxID=69962 RepID=A0A839T7G2_AZOMA|nr:amino acid adenylation domain-containing protein [Azomonas macrocytogenes]